MNHYCFIFDIHLFDIHFDIFVHFDIHLLDMFDIHFHSLILDLISLKSGDRNVYYLIQSCDFLTVKINKESDTKQRVQELTFKSFK